VSVQRRPLGRGRTLAALAGLAIVVGCILPWWKVGGTSGIPAISGNGLDGPGIIVFLCGIVTLALVALPYAAGDRPLGLDRWLSFAFLAVAGWLAFAVRIVVLIANGAFQYSEPAQVFTSSPGLWLTGIGLVMLARAAYTMSRESIYR
jgi:hypothetical protein